MHRLQVGRAPYKLPFMAALLLKEYRQRAPDKAGIKRALLFFQQRLPARQALRFHAFADLLGKVCSRSTWPRRIFERICLCKTDLANN